MSLEQPEIGDAKRVDPLLTASSVVRDSPGIFWMQKRVQAPRSR